MIRAFARLLAVTSLLGAAVCAAQPYPSKPIRLIIPCPPGGATDILGRTLAQKRSTQWGHTVIEDYKPGPGGTLGAKEAGKAVADGCMILLATTSTQSIAPSLYKIIPYSAEKDFAPISEVATATKVIIAAPNLPVRDEQ